MVVLIMAIERGGRGDASIKGPSSKNVNVYSGAGGQSSMKLKTH